MRNFNFVETIYCLIARSYPDFIIVFEKPNWVNISYKNKIYTLYRFAHGVFFNEKTLANNLTNYEECLEFIKNIDPNAKF